MKDIRIGIGMCGSFCTYRKIFSCMEQLKEAEAKLTPVFSFQSQIINSRFGDAADLIEQAETICGTKAIKSIETAEPVGPKKMFDIFLIAPCTGNTLAKLALGITDSPVLMAAKSHLRIDRPVVIFVSTNDALSANFKNIGQLMNTKNIYFVPFSQDDCNKKPHSLVSDLSKVIPTIEHALIGSQIQPVIMNCS